MKLVILAAVIAICSAAKLDRSYLPPPSAASAGGNSESLQTPLTRTSDQGASVEVPSGSYTNSFEGVVVDAAAAGTRASPDINESGLGGPRDAYGSTNSKVGEAAFRGSLAGFRTPTSSGANGISNFGSFESKQERPQASKDRSSNVISYANDVSVDNYSYGFETDNGIAVGENGVANNGIQAQGGYSFKADDGQVYKVTYTADEGGYRPQGNHLPTPPPIPKEILESLEYNAKEEAAGIVDDGSYDAKKYNAEGDYTHRNGGSQYNTAQLPHPVKRPESDASASGSFINQNSQAFGKPNGGHFGNQGNFNGQSHFSSQTSFNFATGNNQNAAAPQDKESSHLSGSQQGSSNGFHASGQLSGGLSQGSQNQGNFGVNTQLSSQNNNQGLSGQFETQGSLGNNHGATSQSSQLQVGFQAGSQFGVQPTKPVFGQGFNLNLGAQFGNQASKPQESFGQAQNTQTSGQSQYNQGLSGVQNPDSHKPASGTFGFTKPVDGQTSSIGSSNGGNNNHSPGSLNNFDAGYLPPLNSNNNKPSYGKPQITETSQQVPNNADQSTLNSIPSGQIQAFPQTSSSSAFASVGQSGFETQPTPVNSFQTQSPSRPDKFNFNRPTNQGAAQQSSFQNSGSNALSSVNPATISQSKPTTIPNTELTTPFESYEKPALSQGSFFNSQSTFGNVGFQPLNNQGQSQFGVQGSQQSGQTLLPAFPTALPQGIPQVSVSPSLPSSTPATFSTQEGSYYQNTFNQNQQQSSYYSTQKPSFSQGPDNSYYYNQPSKPFNTPGARPQGSRFPNTPSYQSNNGIVSGQNNQFPNQQGTSTSFANFPSTSFSSVAPTSSSHITQTQGFSSNTFNNGITQAAVSPFPSISPTTSSQLGNNEFGSQPNFSQTSTSQFNIQTIPQTSATQTLPSRPNTSFGQKPSTSFTQSQNQFGQSTTIRPTSQNIDTQTASTLTQQYEGTVYEYSKPAVTLPPPAHTGSSVSQNVQTDSSSKPQFGFQNTGDVTKPQFGVQPTQFTQTALSPQMLQTSLNLGAKPQTVFSKPFGTLAPSNSNFGQNVQSTNQASLQHTQGSQGNIQQSKPNTSGSFTSQFGQGSYQSYKPFSTPQVTSQFAQNTQTNFGSQSSQQKPSKPFGSTNTQFGQVTQTQGSYNSGLNTQGTQFSAQPLKPFGTTGLAQTFGSGSAQTVTSRPQFGAQTQFTQQQSYGNTQTTSQQEYGLTPTTENQPTQAPVHGSPDTLKPNFGQNTVSQGYKPSGSVGQTFQSSFGLSTPKPQLSGQNLNSAPFQTTSNKGLDSSLVGTSQIQSYKPFGSSSFQSQVQPQSQTSQTGSISGSATFETQTGSHAQNRPNDSGAFGSTHEDQTSQSGPCCQGSSGSTISAVNLSKPSQAFAQTQSQFSGFHGNQFSASSVAGKGEEFGGPREPPRFDATGYHY